MLCSQHDRRGITGECVRLSPTAFSPHEEGGDCLAVSGTTKGNGSTARFSHGKSVAYHSNAYKAKHVATNTFGLQHPFIIQDPMFVTFRVMPTMLPAASGTLVVQSAPLPGDTWVEAFGMQVCGRRFRALSIVDAYSGECLTIEVHASSMALDQVVHAFG